MNESDYLGPDLNIRSILSAIESAVTAVGEADRRVSTSQIGFYRKRPFAAVWRPNQYLRGSHPPRWKEVYEPKPGRFTHHLEINDATEVDDQVREWLREAWASAAA